VQTAQTGRSGDCRAAFLPPAFQMSRGLWGRAGAESRESKAGALPLDPAGAVHPNRPRSATARPMWCAGRCTNGLPGPSRPIVVLCEPCAGRLRRVGTLAR
jgi:hypothetical protein